MTLISIICFLIIYINVSLLLPVSGIDPILFARYPRILVTTLWGEPDPPKIEPPNLVNRADVSPPLFPSADATISLI